MNVKIRMATINELDEIMILYRSLTGYEGCPWDEEYPSREFVKRDIDENTLYMIEKDNNEIVAVAAVYQNEELDSLECWSKEIKKPATLSRIAVKKEYNGMGLATKLIKYIEGDTKKKGFDGLHFLVDKNNFKALSLYEKLGYKYSSEVFMYEIDFLGYEKNY